MANIDLSGYNLAELKGLQFDIEKEIKNRQQQDVKKAREQILEIAQNMGISVEELLAKGTGKSKKAGGGAKVNPNTTTRPTIPRPGPAAAASRNGSWKRWARASRWTICVSDPGLSLSRQLLRAAVTTSGGATSPVFRLIGGFG